MLGFAPVNKLRQYVLIFRPGCVTFNLLEGFGLRWVRASQFM